MVLKAGESVFQTLLLTKTVVHAYRGAPPLFHALSVRQNNVWDAFSPPLMKPRSGARSEEDLFSWLRVGLLPRLYADFAAESEHAQNAWYRDFQSDFHGKPMRNHGFP